MKNQEKTINAIEKRIKDSKAKLKDKTDELELKLQLKRLGGEEFKAENEQLLEQIDAGVKELDPRDRADKRKITALYKPKQNSIYDWALGDLGRAATGSNSTAFTLSLTNLNTFVATTDFVEELEE